MESGPTGSVQQLIYGINWHALIVGHDSFCQWNESPLMVYKSDYLIFFLSPKGAKQKLHDLWKIVRVRTCAADPGTGSACSCSFVV